MTIRSFPSSFLWGASTAGHQVEGNNANSDIWFLEQQEPSVFREPSGIACDSYERWAEDLDLVASLGSNCYRFSIEWARIEPEPGVYSSEELAHYEAIVDGCIERGLAPVVTFNHFSNPHWFAMNGGFTNPEGPAIFARYCDQVMTAFGDRIAYALTLNEPNLHRLLEWIDLPPVVRELERATLESAARSAGVEHYCVGNVVVPEDYAPLQAGFTAAHLAAKAAIKKHRPELPVGFAIAMVDDCVIGDDATVRDAKRADLYDHWLDLAADDDFVGVQNYERAWYDADGAVVPNPDGPRNGMGSVIDAGSLEGCVRYAYERSGTTVLVTEHGINTDDDTLRAGFIEPSLAGLLDAMDDGVPVIGYMHWTLLDNFEWVWGFHGQLGLHSVDRDTMERTRKPSADLYERIVRASAIEA